MIHSAVGRLFLIPGVLAASLLVAASAGGAPAAAATGAIVVTSVGDLDPPPQGQETLRSAIRRIAPGGTITFAARLNGLTIGLTAVGEEHTILKGEAFPAGTFAGYQERDYGRSALYARKDLTIDASSLPGGITLSWQGGDASPARVLAVYGNLVMRNVTVTGGHARWEELPGNAAQPYTLGRGGGVAVWGRARLTGCTISGNRATGDPNGSRDRGAFGGGIYGNLLELTDCTVSGNAARGYGAAGGGVYSVGGAETMAAGSALHRCAVTGNRATGQHAYGGGVYSDGGGPGNRKSILLENCTIARNVIEDNPDLPQLGQYYYRGGGFYMSNGSLAAFSCTIVQNGVTGHAAPFSNKPNMGGGGIAATIGNAHVVERMVLRHSIVAGNTVAGAPGDVYTGSLMHFFSQGYNLVGAIDFSQILVPIPPWLSLGRKHWPKVGDRAGVALAEAIDAEHPRRRDSIRSVGADTGEPAVLWFPPAAGARGRIPAGSYRVRHTYAGYNGPAGTEGSLLNEVVSRLRTDHGDVLGADFGSGFGDLSGITFASVSGTWPSDPANAPWIAFWRTLDTEIAGRLGPAGLADGFWRTFSLPTDPEGLLLRRFTALDAVELAGVDQRGRARPVGARGDIGAIER
jgi:hypothetical protein